SSTTLPVAPAPSIRTPTPLDEITLRAFAAVPPTTFQAEAPVIAIPVALAPAFPPRSRPTQQPAIVLPSPSRSRIPVENPVTERPSTLLDPARMSRPTVEVPPVPLCSSISGTPAKPGWLSALTTTGVVITGSALDCEIVWPPFPGIANLMVSRSTVAFAARIAALNEPGPELLVLVTTKVAALAGAADARPRRTSAPSVTRRGEERARSSAPKVPPRLKAEARA